MQTDALLAQVEGCTLCAAHLPLAPRPILQFSPAARILIAGQAPGRRTHELGVPFADPSGDRLRAWLGLSPETFYSPEVVAILPMGFCFPGSGKQGDLPPRSECAPAWRQVLLDKLVNVQLTLVIGSYAQAWHLPESTGTVTGVVEDWRHRWPEVVPLPHPSPRNNRWLKVNPWFETTLLPVLRERIKLIVADAAKASA